MTRWCALQTQLKLARRSETYLCTKCCVWSYGRPQLKKSKKNSASGRNFLDPLPPLSSKKGPTDENVGISYLIVIIKFGFFQLLTPPPYFTRMPNLTDFLQLRWPLKVIAIFSIFLTVFEKLLFHLLRMNWKLTRWLHSTLCRLHQCQHEIPSGGRGGHYTWKTPTLP